MPKQPEYPNWPWVQAGSYSPPDDVHVTMWLDMENVRRAGPNAFVGWFEFSNDSLDDDGGD